MKAFVWLSLGFLVFAGVSMGDQMGVTGAIVPENTVSNFIYVNNQSVYASDTNSGTNVSLPLKTISKAVSIAAVNNTNGIGTKIIIYPGIYRENVCMWGNGKETTAPIIFEAWSNGTAIISGSDIWTNWQQSANLYTNAWTNKWGYMTLPDGTTNPIVGRRELIFINGNLVTQVLSLTNMQANTFYVDDTNAATVYIWPPNGISLSDPSTNVVEVGQRNQLFWAQSKTCVVLRGLTIVHGTFPCWGGSGGFLYSTNILVENCQILWNNGGTFSFARCRGVTLSNCVAEYNGGWGFMCGPAANVLFVDNDFSYNNWRGAMGGWYGWSQAGCKCGDIHNGVFRRQSAVGNQCHGLWFDTDNTNILFDSCFFSENLFSGLQLEACPGPIVLTNNVICYNQTHPGVDVSCSENITLNNNTIYGNAFMYTNGVMHQIGVGADSRWVWNWETGVSNRIYAVNYTMADNILVATDARQTLLCIGPTGTNATSFFNTFAFNRNHMWYNNLANDKTIASYGYYYNFTNWEAATGFGSDSTCALMTSITSPTNNAVFIITTNLASMTIMATAVDSDGGSDGGTISNVTFYNGTTLLGADATPPTPYSMVWSNIAAGSYALSAVAWDNYVPGDSRTSTPVNVQVWSDLHIGSNGGDSATSYNMNTYTVSGGGVGPCTNADSFRFVYIPVTGCCSIVARVVSCSGSTGALTRAGVMMRESTNANSIELSTLFDPQSNWIDFSCRAATGGNTGTQGAFAAALPYWVKLQRGSNGVYYSFNAWMSSNGTTWVRAAGNAGKSFLTNFNNTSVLQTGLAVSSGDTNSTLTVTFDNVSIVRPY